jgi:trehalose/maltose hydrolase-like predicted phosphorylase
MSGPISPDPVREWRPDHLPVYVSNGLIGLRFAAAPLRGVATVNGFVGPDPREEVESLLPIPYPLAGDVAVDGVPISSVPAGALLREQRYDFARGEVRTALSFTTGGVRADLDVRTVCNRAFPTIAMQEVTVRVDAGCELELSAGVDAGGPMGTPFLAELGAGNRYESADGVLGWRGPGDLSSCGIAWATELAGAEGCTPEFRHTVTGRTATAYRVTAEPGRAYRLRQLTSVVTDAFHWEPHLHAVRMLEDARARGFDALLTEHAEWWAELWRGRIELTGAPTRWQALTDAAFFYLHTSVHRASPSHTSPFGMAYWPDYHYYRGHVMWDIETFAVPALLLTQPDAARTLLGYRRSRLGGARSNAEAQGYAGAQFPWESGPRTGQEATPIGGEAPSTEHHVSADVAVACAQYVHATGDDDFARTAAWPVLSEVARWIASRVRHTGRGYEIQRVQGVAETGGPVDNNAFVNMSAARALHEAAVLAPALGLRANDVWARIADDLVLPRNADGAIVNHDDYRPDEPKGATPEAAAGIFPIGYPVDPETERRTLSAAVDNVDPYVGSPMLSALLGVYAARLGERDRALELYERGFAEFVAQPHFVVTEYSPSVYPDQPRAGPFIANLGGFLTGCLYGLTGMTLRAGDPTGWCRGPVTMPQGWDGVHVERLWVRGRPATLTAVHGEDRARLDLA